MCHKYLLRGLSLSLLLVRFRCWVQFTQFIFRGFDKEASSCVFDSSGTVYAQSGSLASGFPVVACARARDPPHCVLGTDTTGIMKALRIA